MSTCAAAVAGEKVYYAVKVVIDADLDREWYAAIANPVAVDLTGMKEADYSLAGIDLATLYDEDEKTTLYYNFNGYWEDADATGFEFGVENLQFATVDNPGKAKVCVSFKSEVADFTEGVVGDYYVKVLKTGADEGIMLVVDADDAIAAADPIADTLAAWAAAGSPLSLNALAAAFPVDNAVGYIYANGEVAVVGKLNDKCSTSFYNNVTSFFGIQMGTKMTTKLINDNFGWKDEVESCFAWSKAASAIVDAECVVAIPKTGDASVLAWLF